MLPQTEYLPIPPSQEFFSPQKQANKQSFSLIDSLFYKFLLVDIDPPAAAKTVPVSSLGIFHPAIAFLMAAGGTGGLFLFILLGRVFAVSAKPLRQRRYFLIYMPAKSLLSAFWTCMHTHMSGFPSLIARYDGQ
jgi:hypothetical protein